MCKSLINQNIAGVSYVVNMLIKEGVLPAFRLICIQLCKSIFVSPIQFGVY